ncbi:MAG: MGMT family protein [Vicinamibacterales bacterium]
MAARASGSASSSAAERFARRVLAVVARIPPGRVCTYGDVAAMAGAPRAARAVGNVMAHARIPGVPYHRVIAAGGRLGGYSDLQTKRTLLAAEGLEVTRARVRHFEAVRWPRRSRRGSRGEGGRREGG